MKVYIEVGTTNIELVARANVNYMNESQVNDFMRKNKIDPVRGMDGAELSPSIHALTEAEKTAIGEIEIPRGVNAGKKLKDLPELYKASITPGNAPRYVPPRKDPSQE